MCELCENELSEYEEYLREEKVEALRKYLMDNNYYQNKTLPDHPSEEFTVLFYSLIDG